MKYLKKICLGVIEPQRLILRHCVGDKNYHKICQKCGQGFFIFLLICTPYGLPSHEISSICDRAFVVKFGHLSS